MNASIDVSQSDQVSVDRLRGLRGNAFGALVMLLIEFALGMWVNLDATVPSADRGANLFVAIGRAIANGPVGLSIHAIVGLGLIAATTAAFVRALRIGVTRWTVIAGTGLAAIVLATISGSRFVSTNDNGASLAMALFAALAMFCYALLLFRATPSSMTGE